MPVISQWENPKSGFHWPVAVVQKIVAPANMVWETISKPGNLEDCHPFCKKNPVETWPGDTAIDQVHYLNGLVYERRFCRWIEGIGYDLNIGKPDGPTSFVSWRLQPADVRHTNLHIAVYPYFYQDRSIAMRLIPHFMYIRPRLRRYLESVTKGFEWFITRGEAVPRNQFGSHPWFS
ncbi:MAG: hypothetical protein V3W14_11945 [Candidatus Neomarinimicrobiota bacterium]